MKIRCLIFILFAISFIGCKKFLEEPKEACILPFVDLVAHHVDSATLLVSFTAVTSASGTNISHTWDFGDGTTFNGPNPPPHQYPPQSGTGANSYKVKYRVANECGEAFWTRDITISACLPSVHLTYTFVNDSTVQFTNTTSSASPVTYLWNFGDGTTSTSSASTLTHTYHADQAYTVSLKGTNACGDNFTTVNLSICRPPVPVQTITVSSCATVTANASASQNGAKYQWNFGNGTILPATPSTSPTITYTYPNSGSYTITLAVINAAGCDTAYTSNPVTINATAVVPNNNWTYTSDDNVFNFSREAVGNATAYTWNFGDNTTSNQQNPGAKTYASPGVYTVSLGASNACGAYNFSTTITVPYYKPLNNIPNTGFQEVLAVFTHQIYYLGTNGKLYKTDTSGNWSAPINLPAGLTFNENTRLFKDVNNNLWIYGRNEVAKFNPASGTWTSFYASTGFQNNVTINSIAIDNTGALWTVGDERVKKGNTTVSSGNNNEFNSIAFAPSTGRMWVTAANRNSLYYFNTSGNITMNTVNVAGLTGGGDEIKVYSSGEIYFTTATGLMRVSGSGSLMSNFTSANTNGLLDGRPKQFDIDENANLWMIYSGHLIKVPINASNNAKDYSITPDLTNLSFLDVLIVSGTNDTDILLAKTTGNAAIKIR